MARVLRVVIGTRTSPERDVELRRIFGNDVQVTTLGGQPEPAIITDHAQHLDVDAVLFDIAPNGAIEHLRENRPTTQILRPVFEERETRNRYGYPTIERAFSAYGNANEPGELIPVRDI